jgi:DNA polymerase-3 subunit alpha
MSKLFVNLHNHSMFSLGDSISRPDDMARRAKELGMNALAISEHGTLASWLMFKDACKKYGIKPIFGLEAYFVDNQQAVIEHNANLGAMKERIVNLKKYKHKDTDELEPLMVAPLLKEAEAELEAATEERNKMRKYNHLILLAKNWEGCLALIKMHNASVIDGTYYKPRMDWKVLEDNVPKGSIIALSACLGGRIAKLVANSEFQLAIDNVHRYNAIFGKGNFYLELQLNEINLQKDVNIELLKIAAASDTPIVVTCDSHFVEEGGHETRGLIRQLGEEDYSTNDDQLVDLYIKNEDILFQSWQKYMPDVPISNLAIAIKNTRGIADRIESFAFDTSLKFPTFETNTDDSQEEFLTKSALKGLMKKGLHTNPLYLTRLKMELKTITKLGFSSYFNITGDIVNTARKSQAVGPGRGSAAGSLVAFVLGITNVDPIKFQLYFERFLDESKGVIMPTFGLEIAEMSLKADCLLKRCECHSHV